MWRQCNTWSIRGIGTIRGIDFIRALIPTSASTSDRAIHIPTILVKFNTLMYWQNSEGTLNSSMVAHNLYYCTKHIYIYLLFDKCCYREKSCVNLCITAVPQCLTTRCWWFTHRGRVPHICVNKYAITGTDNRLSLNWRQAFSRQCWFILNGAIGDKDNWIINQHTTLLIQADGIVYVVCKMVAILFGLNVLKLFYG